MDERRHLEGHWIAPDEPDQDPYPCPVVPAAVRRWLLGMAGVYLITLAVIVRACHA